MEESRAIGVFRWVTRVLGTGVLILFLVFMIGEGCTADMTLQDTYWDLTLAEQLGLLCIPLMMGLGILLGWMNELMGGIVVILSFVLFNVIGWVVSGNAWHEIDFWFVLVLGMLFLILGILQPSFGRFD